MSWLYSPLLGGAAAGGTVAYTLTVEPAALTFAGQDVDGAVVAYYDPATIMFAGQSVTFDVTLPVTPAALTVAGQDIAGDFTLSAEPAALTLVGQAIDLEGGVPVPVPVADEQPSGGWMAENYAAIERQQRRREERWRREDEEELAKLVRRRVRLEDAQAKVADALGEDAGSTADLERLRALTERYAATADLSVLSRRAQRAIDYAERAQSALAYELALREIAAQLEQEEMALLLILAEAA